LDKSLPQVSHVYQNHHLDSRRWKRYQPRDDDIIISTSYKSGTTWTQGIMRHLVFLEQEMPPLDDLSPWLDRRWRPLKKLLRDLDAQTHRRFIKTHLALDGLPYYPQVKYVVVGRDTRDVFMSLWNHYSHYTPMQYKGLNDTPGRIGARLPKCPSDIHKFWHNWISRGWFAWESEGYPFWGNMHHTATWWEYRHLDNILFVHFNDLLANLTGEIHRMADFLNIPVSKKQLQEIARGVSLENMRQEAEETDAGLVKSFRGGANTFFFKGVNGRWKDVLTAEELELYPRALEKNLTPEAAHWIQYGRQNKTP
jgi:aryl sulfotransferase